MTYRVLFTTAGAREVHTLPRVRDRLLGAIEDLVDDPGPHTAKELVGETAWRIRVGGYAVICEVFDDALTVAIVRAAHRLRHTVFHCEGLGACLDIEMSIPFVRSPERVPLTMRHALSGAGARWTASVLVST
jgi:mRNA-degrading endonuclease RelE of RelBE toxin-antitoxin system